MLRAISYGKEADWYAFGALLYEMLVGLPAYYSADIDEHYRNIMSGSLKMPPSVSTDARSLIVQLLNRNPNKRLGSGPDGAFNIMQHKFFQGVNWDLIISKAKKMKLN